jgi:hypothetical protein
MGLIKTNYMIEDMGIILPKAYAQINNISVGIDGNAIATFLIQQSREDIINKDSCDTIIFRCPIDKTLPIHKQIYEKSKLEIFKDWEDDIV